jgi:hypothetical protein
MICSFNDDDRWSRHSMSSKHIACLNLFVRTAFNSLAPSRISRA